MKGAFALLYNRTKQTNKNKKQHRRNQMKFNKWTVGLAAVGVVSLASAARADEQMSQVQTALSQTTLSGYVDTSMQYNPGTDQGINRGYPGNAPRYAFAGNDGFSLNAVDIALDKPEDTSQWAAGYHVEMMYGYDSVGVQFGTSSPVRAGSPIASTFPTATVRNAYIRLHTPFVGNGIDWQVGVFDSIIGYESNSDPLNPNFTRSYGYTIEPTTLTGVLGTYKVNDEISFSAGVANAAGGLGTIAPSFVPNAVFESQKAYMGDIALTAPDSMGFLKGATATFGVIHGVDSSSNPLGTVPATGAVNGAGTTTSWYAGATLPTPITQLKVGAAFDYLMEQDLFAATSGASANGDNIWVAGGYATYQATDKLSLNIRAEYLSDDSNFGDPVQLYATPFAIGPVGLVGPRHSNQAEEVTATVQYNLWANVMTRGEFRWDHVAHGNLFGDSSSVGPTTPGFRSDDFLLALNIIYQF